MSRPGELTVVVDFNLQITKNAIAANDTSATAAATLIEVENLTCDRAGKLASAARELALIVASDSRRSITSSEHSAQSSKCSFAMLRSKASSLSSTNASMVAGSR